MPWGNCVRRCAVYPFHFCRLHSPVWFVYCHQVAIWWWWWWWSVHPVIPVGIAVARQRLQDHSLPSSGTKPDLKPSQAASCRQQKTLAPAPPEPQCSAADIVPVPASPSLSAMGELAISLCVKNYARFPPPPPKTANFWAILFVTLKMIDILATVGWVPRRRVEYTVAYGLLRGADKSLARPGSKQANVSVRMTLNLLRRLALQKKKTWYLASRCCWNRARPWHAPELVSFVVGLRTYQHPGM